MNLDIERLERIVELDREIDEEFNRYSKEHLGYNGGQNARILARLKKKGYEISALDALSVLKFTEKYPEMKEIMETWQKLNVKSTRKAAKGILQSHNGILYDTLRHMGAYATGRWSSYGMQVQNSPNTPNTCLLYTSPSPRD